MKAIRLILLTLMMTMASPAWAGYGDLLNEWEGYEPSMLYQTHVQPKVSVDSLPARLDKDFEAQAAEIEKMKARWEGVLEAHVEGEVFYRPNPDRIKRLRPAATDPTVAREALSKGFDLTDLETLAFMRNPGTKAAEKAFRAAIETYSQVLNLEEVLRQYSAFTEGLMVGVGPMKGREPVEMRFPFPGVLALKGGIANQEVLAARETLEIARRSAITAVRKTYWGLLFVHRAQEITAEMVGLLKHLEAVATTRYEAGKTSFQDVIKVRIERETLEEDLITLRLKQRNLEVRILEIVNLPPTAAVAAPASQKVAQDIPDLNSLYDLALKRRQELRRLRAGVGKMERMIEMAETRIYPSYSLNLSLFQDEAISQVGTGRLGEPFDVTTRASVGAGLPKMPWYGTNDAYVRETKQRLEALREELKKAEDETISEVREAWFSLDRARRERTLYAESVVDLAQAALEVSTRGYETGAVSFADVIASYTNWLQANLALERRTSDLGIARAELAAAAGADRQ